MIKRIRMTSVWVSDQDRAIDFYVHKLGFRLQTDQQFGPGMRWVEVVPPGAETGIALVKPGPGQESNQVGVFSNIVFTSDDIQKTYEELRNRGVVFTEAPTQQPWGATQALFQDPDGNGFVLVDRA
jgi:lactoylglutathione lyase